MATKREAKEKAQEMLMHGMATEMGYWSERQPNLAKDLGLTDEEFHALLLQQADRVAKLFGYEKAWVN